MELYFSFMQTVLSLCFNNFFWPLNIACCFFVDDKKFQQACIWNFRLHVHIQEASGEEMEKSLFYFGLFLEILPSYTSPWYRTKT